MIQIVIENANLCSLKGDRGEIMLLYNKFRIKHHNAFQILMKSNTKWDGYVKYISDYATFKSGLLGVVYKEALEISDKVTIVDKRVLHKIKPKIPTRMGTLELYPKQKLSLQRILGNKIAGIPFQICCANLSVGFGKTLLMTSIHKAYQSKLKTLVLLNDSDLFKQFKKEMPELLPDEPITFIQGAKVSKWTQFNVAMVPSLSRNLKKYGNLLSQIDICLIDEADIIDNKTFKSVLEKLYSTQIRVGVSGTLYKGNLKKHIIPNMNKRCFIGDVVDDVKLVDQMKSGKATKTIVKSITLKYDTPSDISYEDEYQRVIVEDERAYKAILDRIKFNMKYDRLPMVVATKFIPHTDRLENYLKKKLPDLKIAGVHHKTKGRDDILEKFRQGDLDILIATTIISRGKNFPLLKYICNASSMDTEERTIQLLGRLVRKHSSKNKTVLDDLIFPGKYLGKHGRHRKNYYLRESLKVINIPRKPKKKKRQKKNCSSIDLS